jgi:hypothetical protein
MGSSLLGKIIGLVIVVAVFCGCIYISFTSDDEPMNYDVIYDSKEGIIVIDLEEAIPEGGWRAAVYYNSTDSDGYTEKEYVTKNGSVATSSDRMKVTITDSSGSLVNLTNHTHYIDLYPTTGSQPVQHYHFTVDDHEYSTSELITLALTIALLVVLIAFSIIRRIVRGR